MGSAAALVVVLVSALPPSVVRPAHAQVLRPSIVLILTDDQRWDTLKHMYWVRHDLVAKGVKFTNGFVSNPLCCPSRASILTGTYSHTNGVWTNVNGPNGGFEAFDDSSTVATWLHDTGYRTALIGKYLNGYQGHWDYVPPGWDYWFAVNTGAYFNFPASFNGDIVQFGAADRDYITRVLRRRALSFIDEVPSIQPLFLFFSVTAPHGPAVPDPLDVRAFSRIAPYRPPSYNELDVSDKPAWARIRRLDRAERRELDGIRTDQLRTLLGVDRAVHAIVRAMTGRPTLFLFTSDNGLMWGEHRWAAAKWVPWEESIRVPFVMRYTGALPAGTRDARRAVNIDLAPTFAEVAGFVPPSPVDGISLLGTESRSSFLIEHLQAGTGIPSYCGVRTQASVDVKYADGSSEAYDLTQDPYELEAAHPATVDCALPSPGP